MKLRVLARFGTVVTVRGSNTRWVGQAGTVIDPDEETAQALLRDLPGVVVPVIDESGEPAEEPVTVGAETVVEMVEIPAEIAVKARTRQVARKPAAKAAKKPKGK